MSETVRILPADVYDALELSALAFGGVGGGLWHLQCEPCCIFGHAFDVEMDDDDVSNALADARINTVVNDQAVRAVNQRAGNADKHRRIPFNIWCAELGVVRGQ